MKNIIYIILILFITFSCTSYNESKKDNVKSAEIAHTKFNDMKNNLSYEEYKSLIIIYGKNQKFPDMKN